MKTYNEPTYAREKGLPHVGCYIRRICNEKYISQEDLANKTGIRLPVIKAIFKCEEGIDKPMAKAIGIVINRNPNWLLNKQNFYIQMLQNCI